MHNVLIWYDIFLIFVNIFYTDKWVNNLMKAE
jgi:hypothetical protein